MSFLPAFLPVSAPGSSPRHTMYVLHGILGSGGNWRSFARDLVGRHPAWRVLLVDLRNHGESHGAPGPHTVQACAADLAELATHEGGPEIVLGHSFGGKIALTYAGTVRPPGLRQVWVLDAPPDARPGAMEGAGHPIAQLLRVLESLPMPLERRGDVVPLLEGQGVPAALAGWMTTNLRRVAGSHGQVGGYVWRFDLHGIREMLEDYVRRDAWSVVENPPEGVAVHLVRGERSDRWSPEALSRLANTRHGHVLPDAGHWLHVDNPAGLLDLLTEQALLTGLQTR